MLVERAEHVHRMLRRVHSVEVSVPEFGAVVDIAEVRDAERRLGSSFPESLRSLYTTEASRARLRWTATPDVFGPRCRYGDLELLAPADVVKHAEGLRALAADAARDYDPNEYPGWGAIGRDWPSWIPIFAFGNGDYFCLDVRKPTTRTAAGSDFAFVFLPPDVMWDDPLPESHGRQVGQGFEDLVTRWSKVGFVFRFSWSDAADDTGIDVTAPVLSRLRQKISAT